MSLTLIYARWRQLTQDEEIEQEDEKTVVFTDQANELPGDAIAQAAGESAEESELPEPTLFYRIDGTVMLRRLRFLHLDLDLELPSSGV